MSCYIDKPIPRPQNPESAGRNPTDVTLDHIAEDLLRFFNEFETLNKTEKIIEKKYDIKKEHDCWPDDYIKRAWEETQGMNKKEREEWATVIILQIVKRSLVQSDLKEKLVRSCEELRLTDTPERMKAEKENVGPKADDGLCSTHRPAERSYQSNEEQKTAGADERLDIKQACGEAPKKKPNLLERLSQSNYVMKTGGAARGDEERSGANPTKYGTETPVADPNMPPKTSENMTRADETICIRIPLSLMFFREPTVEYQTYPNVQSRYKLIDGAPSNFFLWKKKSYAMSFNNETKNAEWVYEILNKDSLANNCMQRKFGDPYHKGHLAAAANHRWCWEALKDSNLNCNIIPQHKTLNTGPWGKLEGYCRRLSKITGVHNVHVYSGPLYLCQMTNVPLREKVVPSDFFKVIIVEKEDGTVEEPECYVMPNKNPLHSDLEKYIVDIDFLERESRMKFTDRRNVGEREIIVKAKLWGQDVNSMIQNANISVRISPNLY